MLPQKSLTSPSATAKGPPPPRRKEKETEKFCKSVLESIDAQQEWIPSLNWIASVRDRMPKFQPKYVKMIANDESPDSIVGVTANALNFKYKLEAAKDIYFEKNATIAFSALSHISHPTYFGTVKIEKSNSELKTRVISKETLKQLVQEKPKEILSSNSSSNGASKSLSPKERDERDFEKLYNVLHFTGGVPMQYSEGSPSSKHPMEYLIGIFDYEAAEENVQFSACYANSAECYELLIPLFAMFLSKFSVDEKNVVPTESKDDIQSISSATVSSSPKTSRITTTTTKKVQPTISDFADLYIEYSNALRPHINTVLRMIPKFPSPILCAIKDIYKGSSIICDSGIDVWFSRCIPDSEIGMLHMLKTFLVRKEFRDLVNEKEEAIRQYFR